MKSTTDPLQVVGNNVIAKVATIAGGIHNRTVKKKRKIVVVDEGVHSQLLHTISESNTIQRSCFFI